MTHCGVFFLCLVLFKVLFLVGSVTSIGKRELGPVFQS